MSSFIDLFLIGDFEELINIVIDKYIIWKDSKQEKIEFLKSLKDVTGIYIPCVHTKNDKIKKAYVKNLDKVDYPTNFVVPSCEILNDCIPIEISRGCMASCKILNTGYTNMPVRERKLANIVDLTTLAIEKTGQNIVMLNSQSMIEFTQFNKLIEAMTKISDNKNVDVVLESLSSDMINLKILENIQCVKKTVLTLTPLGASQRLRNMINKNITKEEMFSNCKKGFQRGVNTIKLYYIIGLANETYQDLEELVETTNSIIRIYNEVKKDTICCKVQVKLKISTFVPKPHTPFEFCQQNTIEKIEMKQQYLKDKLVGKCIRCTFDNPKKSRINAMLSCGSNEISKTIYEAFKAGARFDSSDETFNEKAWNKAFEITSINPKTYINKDKDVFAWDNIDIGIDKKQLKNEYLTAINEL